MRTCLRCKNEMIEGFDFKIDGSFTTNIRISASKSSFSDKLEKLRVAICPKCGEVSLYINRENKVVRKE
ncbi:hypothetical protein [Clostridium sardiniense]|uniref:hypothetical protein n=1 Tax=Clostridium sardiniense TaxID=29369 RepID=UPI003D346BD9